MEYGILIAIGEEGLFQIIGAVDSINEAKVMADGYVAIGPDNGYVPPYEFQIHRRGKGGAYTTIDHLQLA